MKKFTTISDIYAYLSEKRLSGRSVGFVPTMGALHPGHLSLLEKAAANNDLIVCSIFVNPTQFNDPSDLEKYPRPIDEDIALLEQAGCDALFMPSVSEMYTQNEHWDFDLKGLDRVLEGAHRPGHFAGVTQIVYKLFRAIGPCTAYFGQKDAQQFRIIEAMVDELHLPQKLIRCPIVREADGLAMSSRNIHLNESDRNNALLLSRAIFWTRDHYREKDVLESAAALLDKDGVVLDYLQLINGRTLEPVLPAEIDNTTDEVLAVIAAKVGQTRLIDNCIVKPASQPALVS